MKIHCNFTGGNIIVKEIKDNDIFLECDLRDTATDWFYWAFCIEGAQGKTLNFKFNKECIGYFGPAKSADFYNWEWINQDNDGHSFSYTFKENEEKVYFAHSYLYHPNRFEKFAKKSGFEIKTLCKSRKGRAVPFVTFGSGEKVILLSARHHACESTGSYVLEGVLRTLKNALPDGYKVICVPFVDYDGVVDGDQGKARAPHDHNRDYDKISIYPETSKIKSIIDNNKVVFGFDFHSPWHIRERNDTVFIVQKDEATLNEVIMFGKMLEKNNRDCSFKYYQKNDIAPNTEWNKCTDPTYATYIRKNDNCHLSFTLETAYFGTHENKANEEKFLNLGEDFAKTLIDYIKTADL